MFDERSICFCDIKHPLLKDVKPVELMRAISVCFGNVSTDNKFQGNVAS